MALNVEIDHCYVIGIDFGTTYSGVAWCWSGQPDNIQIVTRWKDRLQGHIESSKVPTQLHYGDADSPPSWGYDIPLEVETPIRWFKLLLADSQTDSKLDLLHSQKIEQADRLAKLHQKTAVQLVADYLRQLWTHTMDEMERDRGRTAVNGLPFKVWITIPAIWTEETQERMRQAVDLAGITARRMAGRTTIDFVAEPEAAAHAVFDDYKGRPDVSVNDAFVVCDAGGGTVDLISYRVTATEPMMVEECVEGIGKMCGAIFIDEEFEKLLQNSLSSRQWQKLSPESRKSLMTRDWEHGIKRGFNDQEKVWNVTVPPEANNRLMNIRVPRNVFDRDRDRNENPTVTQNGGYLKFNRDNIRNIFAPVKADIMGLIDKQVEGVEKRIRRKPKSIILVGGLGACNYLHHELVKAYSGAGIIIHQQAGPRPWTAICRGAVVRGLGDAKIKFDRITARISRTNYGITHRSPWKEGLYNTDDRIWDSDELAWKVDNQMRWYLLKGDHVANAKPMAWDYYRLFSRPEQLQKNLEIVLYRNRDEEAPMRKGPTVMELQCIPVQVDLRFEDLEPFVNDHGKAFRKLPFSIEMSSTGVSMTWKIKMNGRVCGEKNLKVEVQDDNPNAPDTMMA